METRRSKEIRKEIGDLKIEYAYKASMIALLMGEANLIDKEIEDLTRDGVGIREKLADLNAELKDTI